ncbi:MAG: DUF1947 domain-containing protein [Caldisphaera sp.]|jgi:PUA domain protein|nr:DUF1947 domain-containing protein [Caldisphaera sp.]
MSDKIKISKRYLLSKKSAKELKERVEKLYSKLNIEWENVERVEYENIIIYVINGIATLTEIDNLIFPTLIYMLKKDSSWAQGVIIDRGATNAVSRGADLMLPGIKGIRGKFKEGDIVFAFDIEKSIPVMVGKALLSSDKINESINQKAKGRAIQNLHYAGDLIWKISISI